MIFRHNAEPLPVGRPFEINGVAFPANWLDNATPDDLAAYQITVETDPDPKPYVPTADDLIARAAEKRWEVEVGGVAWGDQIINTDRDSQTKLLAEFVAMGARLRVDGEPWKFRAGARPISNAEMAAVVVTARTHIANAFGVEAEIAAAILAGTITTVEEIDAAAWPANG